MATATTIINGAMRKLALISSGESASASELTDALECLNDLLSAWSVEQIILPYTIAEAFSLVVGKGSYTIGSGADFDTTRPLEIISAFIRDANNIDYLLDIQNYALYNALAHKSNSNRPSILYYKPVYPTGTIYFDYLPIAVESLYIESIKYLTSFADLSSDVSIAPELKTALVYNLAIEIAPEFGAKTSDIVNTRAFKTLSVIKSLSMANAMSPINLNMPGATKGYYSIDSDT